MDVDQSEFKLESGKGPLLEENLQSILVTYKYIFLFSRMTSLLHELNTHVYAKEAAKASDGPPTVTTLSET